jgi:hypothetical protein
MALVNLLPQKWATARERQEDTPLPAKKRIQTPAGARLSHVLNADASLLVPSPRTPKTPKSPLTLAKSAGAVIVTREVDVESFRQSQLRRNTQGTTQLSPIAASMPDQTSLFSEKSLFAGSDVEGGKARWQRPAGCFGASSLRDVKRGQRFWVLIALGVLAILGLIIGLSVGLTMKSYVFDSGAHD